jgi:sulfite exporter TauE/SafE
VFNTLLTHFQLIGIGLSLGLAGPCVLTCTSIIASYTAGSKKDFRETMADVFVFTLGRFSAYAVLGGIAGLSGGLLNRFTGPQTGVLFKTAAGAVSILLGVYMLVRKTQASSSGCKTAPHQFYSGGGLFVLGLTMGLSPCPPLAALLLEIALISKNVPDGVAYASSFGLGTLMASIIVIGGLTGLLNRLPLKIFRSEKASLVLKISCAAFLILFGLWLIVSRYLP